MTLRLTGFVPFRRLVRPLVVRQACADRSPALHENNLADLDAKYADVVALAEALDRLREPAVTSRG